MKGGKLIWTWTEKGTKETERVHGPKLDQARVRMGRPVLSKGVFCLLNGCFSC